MLRLRVWLALLLAAFSLWPHGSRAQSYEGRELVRAEVLADTNAIVPGKAFTVGVLLHQAPGWHTYWKFPGDAGIPTEVKWNLPAGWKAGEIQWPIPLKLSEPGDILIYGYHDDVLLMQEITPPSTIAASSVKLAAEASWLVCEKICIPGGAKLQTELPVAADNAPANEETFAKFRRALPQAWPNEQTAKASWLRRNGELQFAVGSAVLANYPSVEFLPAPDASVVVGHPKSERGPNGTWIFHIPIDTTDANVASLNGILVFGASANAPDRIAWSISNSTPAMSAVVRPTTMVVAKNSALKFLLFGFLGGFILNLMPCVLPVISLKIFGFVQHAGESRARILRSGLAFIAGIFAWFVGLAILLIFLKRAGHELTWAFQFTNPLFVVVMSAVVLVFALNLFGVFEIALPQMLTRGALGWSAQEGDAGSFFQGVFATVLATPCTAPFLGTALGFAFTQSGWMILLMFVAIAAGMSAPYLVLSAQPAWLKLLPKPGAWMVRVKQFMGFLLLATLLFLLAVLGAQRGVDAIVWTCAFLLVVSIACWMQGAFVLPTVSLGTRITARLIMFALVAGAAFYFIGGKFSAAKIPSSETKSAGNDWQNFSTERLQQERDAGHAVFVDFTAAWCITCKFNEATVLESGAVRDAFHRRAIVKLRGDWTNADPVITKILQQFGRPGVPLYVFYPAGKNEEPFVFPELLTQNIVLQKIDSQPAKIAAK